MYNSSAPLSPRVGKARLPGIEDSLLRFELGHSEIPWNSSGFGHDLLKWWIFHRIFHRIFNRIFHWLNQRPPWQYWTGDLRYPRKLVNFTKHKLCLKLPRHDNGRVWEKLATLGLAISYACPNNTWVHHFLQKTMRSFSEGPSHHPPLSDTPKSHVDQRKDVYILYLHNPTQHLSWPSIPVPMRK